MERTSGSYMAGRWENIIRALPHIDIVVGMDQLSRSQFVAAIRNNLIYVHVRMCTAACLPHR